MYSTVIFAVLINENLFKLYYYKKNKIYEIFSENTNREFLCKEQKFIEKTANFNKKNLSKISFSISKNNSMSFKTDELFYTNMSATLCNYQQIRGFQMFSFVFLFKF